MKERVVKSPDKAPPWKELCATELESLKAPVKQLGFTEMVDRKLAIVKKEFEKEDPNITEKLHLVQFSYTSLDKAQPLHAVYGYGLCHTKMPALLVLGYSCRDNTLEVPAHYLGVTTTDDDEILYALNPTAAHALTYYRSAKAEEKSKPKKFKDATAYLRKDLQKKEKQRGNARETWDLLEHLATSSKLTVGLGLSPNLERQLVAEQLDHFLIDMLTRRGIKKPGLY